MNDAGGWFESLMNVRGAVEDYLKRVMIVPDKNESWDDRNSKKGCVHENINAFMIS